MIAGRTLRRVVVAVAIFAAGASIVTAAHAQMGGTATMRENRSSNLPVVERGAPGVRQCIESVQRGASDEDAVTSCTRAIENVGSNRRDHVALLINRGAIHLRRREGELALADFEAALALEERNAEALVNRGGALLMVGRPGPAVAAITQALLMGVSEPHKAYFNRGAAREALGDLRGAYEDYSAALEINPNWAPAEQELQRFVRAQRDRLASVFANEPGASQPASPQPRGGTP